MDLHSMVINLRPYNTFGIDAKARVFSIKNTANIVDYFSKYKQDEYFVLGSGSNVILGETIKDKNILKIEIMGKEIVHEEGDFVYVRIGAGENWDDVVLWSIKNNLSGIEALSAIPGTAGATPVQNVGAYGSEIKDVLDSVTVYDTLEDKIKILENKDCDFSYRNSIFKSSSKGRYIITDIKLCLSKLKPKIPNYSGVQKYFEDKNITDPSLEEIRNAIVEIRWSKLPHPEELGNCGSFFENPIVSLEVANKIKEDFPEIPIYPVDENKVKISAGFLVEKAGLKGYSFGNVATYEKNALVLVNNGNASQEDVLNAKNEIINKVKEVFGIELKSEPEFVN